MMTALRQTRGQPLVDAAATWKVLNFLLPLSDAYPAIDQWFAGKVVPGLGTTRHIVTVERHGQIAALGIAKNEGGEKKLCTIRVAPEYEGRGMGVRVMDDLMRWLDTDLPLATVSAEKLQSFERIFAHYGFLLTSVANGVYRQGRAEFLFNEPASPLMRLR